MYSSNTAFYAHCMCSGDPLHWAFNIPARLFVYTYYFSLDGPVHTHTLHPSLSPINGGGGGGEWVGRILIGIFLVWSTGAIRNTSVIIELVSIPSHVIWAENCWNYSSPNTRTNDVNTTHVGVRLINYNKTILQISHCAGGRFLPGYFPDFPPATAEIIIWVMICAF